MFFSYVFWETLPFAFQHAIWPVRWLELSPANRWLSLKHEHVGNEQGFCHTIFSWTAIAVSYGGIEERIWVRKEGEKEA